MKKNFYTYFKFTMLSLLISAGFSIQMFAQEECAGIDGGTVELEIGGEATTIIIDGNPDVLSFTSSVEDSEDYEFTYVVTDDKGKILGIPPGNMVDFDPAGLGACLVYGLTYTGTLQVTMGDDLFRSGDLSDDCFDLSDNRLLVNRIGPNDDPCIVIDGGKVALESGGSITTIFIDGEDDFISFTSDVPSSNDYTFTYVVTDANGMILGIPPGNTVNFEPAGLGVCRVYGLTYTGNLNIEMGNDLFSGEDISDGCFDLSSNSLTINRINTQEPRTQIFASSNNSGQIGIVNFFGAGVKKFNMDMFPSSGMDADGIYYDKEKDRLFQLNRSNNVVDVYDDVNETLMDGGIPTISFSSSSDFVNGREITVSGKKLVVAQDAADGNSQMNTLFVYDIDSDALTLANTYSVGINLWGIHANSRDLYAIVDNSNQLVLFTEFFDNADGLVAATQTITVENLVRTHGLNYNAGRDMMMLTDIGDAGIANDGALVVIKKFSSKIGDDMISADEQVRVGGPSSMLGNPVDVALDDNGNRIYVAERATNGGMILGFAVPVLSGGIKPGFVKAMPGASAVQIFGGQEAFCNFLNAGTVALETGGTETTIIIDNVSDVISFTSTAPANPDATFTYVVTDNDGMILGIPPGNMVDFDPAGVGICRVYGVVYTGDLLAAMGDDFFEVEFSTECTVISSNRLTVNRLTPQAPNTRIFASSNNSATVGVINVFDEGATIMDMFASNGMDADGLFYDEDNDRLFQLNRSNSVVDVYTDVAAALDAGNMPTLVGSSTSDFSNGRAIAVSGNKMVVANDVEGANTLVTYDIGDDNSLTLNKINPVDFNLWGIHLNGSILFAIADNSNNVALIKNFFNKPGGDDIIIEHFFAVENLVRTHGITFVPERDMLILTDIGDAGSANDGALVVIKKFSKTFMDDEFISASEQIRVSGISSRLGNPVDVDFDHAENMIYVAERATQGGLILGFRNPILSGGIKPNYTKVFPGASAVEVPGNAGDLCNFLAPGTVAFDFGGTETTIFIDGEDDLLSFTSTSPDTSAWEFTYVVTDGMGKILGIPPGNTVNFEPAGIGNCKVYGLAYTGNLLIDADVNDMLFEDQISDGCSQLSSNSLLVVRIEPQDFDAQVYISSNNSGVIGVANILDANSATMNMFSSQGIDADGIYYNKNTQMLYQLNRTSNVIDVYSNVPANPTYMMSSSSDFTNGREIAAIDNNYLVVAQDASDANNNQNRLIVYDISNGGIVLEQSYDVNVNLWGVEGVGADLYAVIDNSNTMAIFENIRGNADGTTVTPDRVIIVDNLVRTHGLTYVSDRDMLILTDIGSAGSAGDGALVIVKAFSDVSDDDVISVNEQIRVSGGTSLLGNPVDVEFSAENNLIYVAERAREGGLLLAFKMPTLSGGIAPAYKKVFTGASAIFVDDAGIGTIGLTENPIVTRSAFTAEKLYPNPATTTINVDIVSQQLTNSTIYIYTANGALVETQQVELFEGKNKVTLNITEAPSGILFLRIPEVNSVLRFIKM